MQDPESKSLNLQHLHDLLDYNPQVQEDPLIVYRELLDRHVYVDGSSRILSDRKMVKEVSVCTEHLITICNTCGTKSEQLSDAHVHSIDLSVEGCKSLDQALQMYFSSYLADGPYECAVCPRRSPATQNAKLEKTPDVLCISLRRVKQTPAKKAGGAPTFSRLNNVVVLSKAITLAGVAYRLVSVIHHLGAGYNAGHYVADVLDWGKEKEVWWRCNDVSVTECEIDLESATKPKYPAMDHRTTAYILYFVSEECYHSIRTRTLLSLCNLPKSTSSQDTSATVLPFTSPREARANKRGR